MLRKTALGSFLFLCLGLTLVLSSQAEMRTFTLDFARHSIRWEEHYLLDNAYLLPEIGGCELTGMPGEPCLPTRAVSIYVPQGSELVSVNAISVRRVELPGAFVLMPAQPEIPLSSDTPPRPVMPDETIYSQAGPYPASPVRIASSGTVAGRKITGIEIFPLQYVPAEQKLIFNEQVTVTVEFSRAAYEQRVPGETENVRELRNAVVRGLVENPEDLAQDFPSDFGTLDPSVACEYLIICIENHADEYEVLKNWKTRKGIPATIETIEDIIATYPGRDAPEQIRNCIKDYYLNQSTAWVLLTLSAPKAKIRGCYCSVGGTVDTKIPCDLYFADMDGDWNDDGDAYWGETYDDVDLYPDVYVGRIPTNKGLESTIAVDKILTYEGRYSIPTDYQLDMLFMAEYADASTDCAIVKNMIDSESVPARFDPITKLYESSGNLNRTSALNALNSGMGIVNHAGHGNAQVLSIGPSALNTEDMLALTNAPRYSVFYTLACDPGNFDNVMGYFARGFLEAPDGGGFFIGNSRYGWYWPGNPGNGTGDRFDREFFESIFVRGYTHLGVAHADAKVQRIPYSGYNDTDRWTQFSLNLFGDPETHIWVDTPIALSGSHPDSIDTGAQDVIVSVTAEGSALSGARVCLWMGDDVYEVETTGGGSAQLSVAPADSGTILVTVTKDGYLPYLGSIRVADDTAGLAGATVAPRFGITVRPNPVTGPIKLAYGLNPIADPTAVPALKVYDAAGRLVRSLGLDQAQSHGSLAWDGVLESGARVPPGIYFLQLTHGSKVSTTKLVILR
jgi:hypothetical protein